MGYTVYILYSKSCMKFYIGQTQDIHNRLNEHNAEETTSIRHCIPWALVWKEELETRSQAMAIEKKIKSRGAERFLADFAIFLK